MSDTGIMPLTFHSQSSQGWVEACRSKISEKWMLVLSVKSLSRRVD
jgi:hypothetical protein